MRIIIYGAGGIGCVVGGHLARTGHDVVLIGRPGHVDAIRANGLKLVTPTGTHILRVPAVTGPDHVQFTPADVIFLCMKGQNTEAAMRDLKNVAADVPVFCLQNGIRNEEIVATFFPRVYGVMVRIGAVYLTDGEVVARRDPPGWLIMGCYPKGEDDLAGSVAAAVREAGFLSAVVDDVMPYKWGKLMDNLGNAIDGITNGPWRDILPIQRAAQRELKDLLAAAGIDWIPSDEVERRLPRLSAPVKAQINTEAKSSTWQSLARRTGTIETEFLNGEVVRLAQRLGRQSPINEKLWQISAQMSARRELPGKYTPPQLMAMLGITADA